MRQKYYSRYGPSTHRIIRQPLSKTAAGILFYPAYAEVKKNDGANWQPSLTNGLLLGRFEVLRSLRHYLRQAQSQRTSHHRSPRWGKSCRKRKHWTIFPPRTRKGRRLSDGQRRPCFKVNAGEPSERRAGAYKGTPEPVTMIWN